jgi:hypothetical protein
MILNGTSALLGLAGTITSTVVSGWIAPVLIALSIVLIGRSFYVIYVRGKGTWTTIVIAWSAFVFMVGFWTWRLTASA